MKEHYWIFDIKSEGNCPVKKKAKPKSWELCFFFEDIAEDYNLGRPFRTLRDCFKEVRDNQDKWVFAGEKTKQNM